MRPLVVLVSLLATSSAIASPNQVDVCHSSGSSGNISMLAVNVNALSSHIAHGDWLPTDFFVDVDGDGYGDASATVYACEQPSGTAVTDGDCDDADALVNPGMTEVCGNGIDDNCDGQIDEGCLVEVEIKVMSDNANFVWIDGQPFSGAFAADWAGADTTTLMLPPGPHSVAVYVEDWGGYGWFAASVKAEGQFISQTGDGSWVHGGYQTATAYGNTYQRGWNWPSTPADGVTGLEVTPPNGWTAVGYDDSAWATAEVCTGAGAAFYDTLSGPNAGPQHAEFGVLAAEGTEWVFTAGAACRTSALAPHGTWQIGLFRTNFSL